MRLITGENVLKGDTVWVRWADGTVVKAKYVGGDYCWDGETYRDYATVHHVNGGLQNYSEDFLYLTKGEAKNAPRRWYEITMSEHC